MKRVTDILNRECVSGRELHAFLGIEKDYEEWFDAMKAYCFEEGTDFTIIETNTSPFFPKIASKKRDHLLTLSAANEIVMLQTSLLSRLARKHVIGVYMDWFNPIKLGIRVLELLHDEDSTGISPNPSAKESNPEHPEAHDDAVGEQQKPLSITQIARDYHLSGIRLNSILEKIGVQTRAHGTWSLCPGFQHLGLVVYEPHGYQDHEGKHHEAYRMKWTTSGKKFIHDTLQKLGICPVKEE